MTGAMPVSVAQTFLFVPGNRPDRFEKALNAGAHIVVFDLEDAVPPEDKENARRQVVDAIGRSALVAMVRVNAVDTEWHADDAKAVIDAGAHIMLPKAESPSAIEWLGIPPGSPIEVVALIETPLGVLNSVAIARTRPVSRLAFGSLDFAATIGVDPDDRDALAATRAHFVLVSAAADLNGPIDGVTQAVRDPEALSSDVSYSKRLGFSGKLCIHPAQINDAARILSPSEEEVNWARRILDALADHASSRGGVIAIDGKMIDAPVVKRAQSIVASRSQH